MYKNNWIFKIIKKPIKWLFFLDKKCYNLGMKKLIKIFIGVLLIIFFFVLYISYRDNRYLNKLEKTIVKKMDIEVIKYLNIYGDYYIVMDDNNLYVLDNKYVELLKIDKLIIHENSENYDIIFNEKPMYMNDYYKDNKLYYEYYDLYSYEKIDTEIVGGNYG